MVYRKLEYSLRIIIDNGINDYKKIMCYLYLMDLRNIIKNGKTIFDFIWYKEDGVPTFKHSLLEDIKNNKIDYKELLNSDNLDSMSREELESISFILKYIKYSKLDIINLVKNLDSVKNSKDGKIIELDSYINKSEDKSKNISI